MVNFKFVNKIEKIIMIHLNRTLTIVIKNCFSLQLETKKLLIRINFHRWTQLIFQTFKHLALTKPTSMLTAITFVEKYTISFYKMLFTYIDPRLNSACFVLTIHAWHKLLTHRVKNQLTS